MRHETCRGDIFLQYEICFSTFFMIKLFSKDSRKGRHMKFLPRFLFNCSALLLMSAAANAAGTYYTGNYQSPQRGYATQSYAQRARTNTSNYSSQGVSAYNRNQYANAGYTNSRTGVVSQPQQQQTRAATQSSKRGFSLDAGLSKQVAMWEFEMNTAGSKLHYDNIDWLVFDAAGKYVFDVGNTTLQIGAGLQYGMQMGESTMIDDDISHGGYSNGTYVGEYNNQQYYGEKIGHALSLGTSKDGSMFGFNVGVGLTDFWRWGNVKITPSVGWRYLKYKLETSDNKGSVIVSANYGNECVDFDDGSTQCGPVVMVSNGYTPGELHVYPGYTYFDANGVVLDINENGNFVYPGTTNLAEPAYAAVLVDGWRYAEADGTFYFEQPGVSHSYEVEWSGPYVGLDMQYDINQYNVVTANVELGLPSYTATGDQPYRYDWQHPKSVQDKGGIGSGFHFGVGANWRTAITDSVALSIGVTYDYYSVSDADATTYWNPVYGEQEYQIALKWWMDEYDLTQDLAEQYMLTGTTINEKNVPAESIAVIRANNWEDKVDGEIESFYKSLGVRIGINARF